MPKSCPDCGDSPLSTTANVLGILTFALGLLAYCLAFLTVTRNARPEIKYSRDIASETREQLDQIRRYFRTMQLEADSDLNDSIDWVLEIINRLDQSQQDITGKLEKLSEGGGSSMLTNFRWWLQHEEMAAGMARLESEKQDVIAIQLTFLLSKTKEQRDAIKRLERYIQEQGNNRYVEGGLEA